MGEAKRRKMAGATLEIEEFEELAKDWHDKVAVTLDVEGIGPVPGLIRAEAVWDILEDIDRRIRGKGYHAVVKETMAEFVRAVRTHKPITWFPPFALWIALRHPQTGEHLRLMVSERLRQEEPVHVTVRWNSRGLAVAVGDRPADLQGIRSPTDKAVVMYQSKPGTPPKLNS